MVGGQVGWDGVIHGFHDRIFSMFGGMDWMSQIFVVDISKKKLLDGMIQFFV